MLWCQNLGTFSFQHPKVQILICRGVTLRGLFEKSPLRTPKNFWGKEFFSNNKVCESNIARGLQVILVLCAKAQRTRCRKPRGRQRELALFSARVLYAAQNDVKFVHTNSVKVFAKPFSKGLPPEARPPDKSKFEVQISQIV